MSQRKGLKLLQNAESVNGLYLSQPQVRNRWCLYRFSNTFLRFYRLPLQIFQSKSDKSVQTLMNNHLYEGALKNKNSISIIFIAVICKVDQA